MPSFMLSGSRSSLNAFEDAISSDKPSPLKSLKTRIDGIEYPSNRGGEYVVKISSSVLESQSEKFINYIERNTGLTSLEV